jgi:hypothetical protein
MSTLVATNLKNLIADVPEFRTWTGTANQAAARLRVYVAGVDEGDYTRAFTLLSTGTGRAATRFAGGARDYHDQSGMIWVLFEDDVAPGATHEEAETEFDNDVGEIIDGIKLLAGSSEYLHIHEITLAEPPRRSGKDEDDDYMQVLFGVAWGTG